MPARLITLERHLSVVIEDLSEAGARVALPVPHAFTVCVLKWLDFHAFAEVRRMNEQAVGLRFASPLSTATIAQTLHYAPDLVTQLKRNAANPRGC